MFTRRGILATAITLTAIAFLGSLGHVYSTVNAHDGNAPRALTIAVALMPEITVALVLVKLLTQGLRQPAAWFVGGTALAFSAAANVATREDDGWGLAVALWPAWTSIGAMLLVHARSHATRAELAEQEAARRRQVDEDARRATVAQEEANRLELERQQIERDALDLRERELAEHEAQRLAAEREQRRQQRQVAGPPPTPPGVEDILLHAARDAARTIRSRGETVTRDRLRDQMVADGKLKGGQRSERASALLQLLKAEERRAG